MLARFFTPHDEPAYLPVLHSVPLLSELGAHELQTLNDLLHQRHYVNNEIVFDQDEEGQAIYFVLAGSIKINYHHRPIATLKPGMFFGERALLTHEPRLAQAKAAEDSVLAVLFREDFFNLLKTHPHIAAKITEHSAFTASVEAELDIHAAPPVSRLPVQNGPSVLTLAGILLGTCLTLLIFKKILWLVVPFLLALILYYLLAPIAKRMVQSGATPLAAAISLNGALMLATGAVLLLVYPLSMTRMEVWQADAMRYLSGGASMVDSFLHGLQQRFSFMRNVQLGHDIHQQVQDFSEHFSDKYLGKVLFTIAAWLPSLLLTPIITFFMIKDGAAMRKLLGAAVPNAFFEKTLYLIYAMDRTARLYFLGLIKMTLVDALILSSVLWLMGFSAPLLLGTLVAVLCWIPYLGPLLGFVLVSMVSAADFPGNMLMQYAIIGLFIAMRLLDDLVLLPAIIGRSLRIHPLLTILMFLIGEAIAGVAGLMLAIPILGIAMVLGETLAIIVTDKRLRARYRHSRQLAWQSASKDLDTLD